MFLCQGKEESVNRWNNRGIIAVLCSLSALLSVTFLGAAVGSTDKTDLSALQHGQDAL